MTKYSEKYKRDRHPFMVRLETLWLVLTCRNYIFVQVTEFTKDGKEMRRVTVTRRTDYDGVSDLLTLTGARIIVENRTKNENINE